MKKEDFSFLSSDKKTQIHAIKVYPKDKKITRILQIIHGMTEYIEMEHLIQNQKIKDILENQIQILI